MTWEQAGAYTQYWGCSGVSGVGAGVPPAAGACGTPRRHKVPYEELRMLRKLGEEKGEQRAIITSSQCSGPCSVPCSVPGVSSAGGALHESRGVNLTPRYVSDILFIRKEPFYIPCFPEKNIKSKKKKKKQTTLGLIKGKCSHLGKTEVSSPTAYKKQQTTTFSTSPSPPPLPAPLGMPHTHHPAAPQAPWRDDTHS